MLVLEDLHWSDYATLDLLALLARHQPRVPLARAGDVSAPGRAGTRAPAAACGAGACSAMGRATELPLALLTLEDVTAYLHARFPGQPWPAALAPWLYHHTDGNPLFLVTVLDTLLARGLCADAEGPGMSRRPSPRSPLACPRDYDRFSHSSSRTCHPKYPAGAWRRQA